ncbi:hypothetical protein Btru_017611 [Bulinus truncatus]|nr:hypothetical protein Btru_017611 [Bulinus truncatus]
MVSLTIVAYRGPNLITVKVKSISSKISLTINDEELTRGDIWSLTVAQNQAYVISTCGSQQYVGTVTGTKLTGDKVFGLVSGNCLGRTKVYSCNGSRLHGWGVEDIAAEMLPPIEMFGKDFLTFDLTGSSSEGFYFIVAGHDDTSVTVLEQHKRRADVFNLAFRGSWVEMTIKVSHITSTKGILVVYVKRSPCLKLYNDSRYIPGEKGAPSLMMLVPTPLFYFTYIFRMPRLRSSSNYAVVVVRHHFVKYVTLNSARVKADSWRFMPGENKWVYGQVSILSDLNYTLTSDRSFFGCYLYGHDIMYSFTHPAGYIASHINTVGELKCVRDITRMKGGDLLDNDCDGWIDEEYLNGKAFTSTDVPVTAAPEREFLRPMYQRDIDFSVYDEGQRNEVAPVDPGTVGQWLEWQCQPNCVDSRMFRDRLCLRPPVSSQCIENLREWRHGECDKMCSGNDEVLYMNEAPGLKNLYMFLLLMMTEALPTNKVCTGNLFEWTNGTCYVHATCPEDCLPYKWGVNCINSCENCVKDCDKYSGICEDCKPGFFDASASCLKDEYGPWKEWHCSTETVWIISCIERDQMRFQSGAATVPRAVSTCEKDCVTKFTGICEQCRPGYKNPNKAVQMLVTTIIMDTTVQSDYIVKCGFDCIEKSLWTLYQKMDTVIIKPKRSSYTGKIGIMPRKISYAPQHVAKNLAEAHRKKIRHDIRDLRSLSSYETDDDDDDDD